MKFRTTIQQTGKTATGIRIPDEVMAALGAGKRPAVRVTIGAHSYRSTVASIGGAPMVGVSAENRVSAGVDGGDVVDVEIELDTAPREVSVPPDFAKALARDAAAQRTFHSLSYSNQNWHVQSIEGAKTDETRQRRIAKSVDALRDGRVR
ncbi:MAG: YdeI/OmpD-associated family protein [Candidatus Limnocylindria bacterium]